MFSGFCTSSLEVSTADHYFLVYACHAPKEMTAVMLQKRNFLKCVKITDNTANAIISSNNIYLGKV